MRWFNKDGEYDPHEKSDSILNDPMIEYFEKIKRYQQSEAAKAKNIAHKRERIADMMKVKPNPFEVKSEHILPRSTKRQADYDQRGADGISTREALDRRALQVLGELVDQAKQSKVTLSHVVSTFEITFSVIMPFVSPSVKADIQKVLDRLNAEVKRRESVKEEKEDEERLKDVKEEDWI